MSEATFKPNCVYRGMMVYSGNPSAFVCVKRTEKTASFRQILAKEGLEEKTYTMRIQKGRGGEIVKHSFWGDVIFACEFIREFTEDCK